VKAFPFDVIAAVRQAEKVEMPTPQIEGQLNSTERRLLTEALTQCAEKPRVVVEVGTWFGGGSTLHILQALEKNGVGHLWGVEMERSVYDQMLANIRAAAPEFEHRFTPLFGCSQDVLRQWTSEQGPGLRVDFAFLDGGNNPREQIDEFRLLDPFIPVGGQIMAHDANGRKGRWLVPYVSGLDNWQAHLHQVSDEGLFYAKKIGARPSASSLKKVKWQLFFMECNPVEIAATLLPAKVCLFALRLMPRRLARRVAEGRIE
jgi:predicted O-methyltransferase YrrM